MHILFITTSLMPLTWITELLWTGIQIQKDAVHVVVHTLKCQDLH